MGRGRGDFAFWTLESPLCLNIYQCTVRVALGVARRGACGMGPPVRAGETRAFECWEAERSLPLPFAFT